MLLPTASICGAVWVVGIRMVRWELVGVLFAGVRYRFIYKGVDRVCRLTGLISLADGTFEVRCPSRPQRLQVDSTGGGGTSPVVGIREAIPANRGADAFFA